MRSPLLPSPLPLILICPSFAPHADGHPRQSSCDGLPQLPLSHHYHFPRPHDHHPPFLLSNTFLHTTLSSHSDNIGQIHHSNIAHGPHDGNVVSTWEFCLPISHCGICADAQGEADEREKRERRETDEILLSLLSVSLLSHQIVKFSLLMHI